MDDYSYIAFLDILGYKNFLKYDVDNGTKIFKTKMIEAFRVFEDVNQTKFAHKVISDSIFITCTERSSAPDLMNVLSKVFISFLEKGLLIRGGVSYGEHFQNQTITYSPALTKAYILESSVAEFPRIMIDRNIIDMFPDLAKKNQVLKTGEHWFLNVATKDNYHDIYLYAKATFESNIQEINMNEKVRIKHKWLQDFLIEISEVINTKPEDKYLKTYDSDIQKPGPIYVL